MITVALLYFNLEFVDAEKQRNYFSKFFHEGLNSSRNEYQY